MICDNCKRMFVAGNDKVEIVECPLSKANLLMDLTYCNHFEEKPKDNSNHLAEAKELANKGKKPRKQPKKNMIATVGGLVD